MKKIFKINSSILVTIFTFNLLLAGCSKEADDHKTAGEKLDSAINKTEQATKNVIDNTKQATSNAIENVQDASKNVAQEAKEGIQKAKEAISDTAITTAIKADLAKEPNLSAIKIEVDTVNGEVTLKGHVRSDNEKQQAETLAKNTKGVNKVINQLTMNQ